MPEGGPTMLLWVALLGASILIVLVYRWWLTK
jgi:hypothetical protein